VSWARPAAAYRTGAALACLAIALLTGCGSSGTLGPRTLAKQSDAVGSLAAEGALLADDGVHGRTTAIFERQHGGFLARAATTAASSLATARTTPALEPELRRLRALSARVRDQLQQLRGASEAEQRTLARSLAAAADDAEAISESLA
jgi:hypothetical protein